MWNERKTVIEDLINIKGHIISMISLLNKMDEEDDEFEVN